MARRKRAFLEDDLDSSEGSQEDDADEQGLEDNDPDARAERSLFEDPYQRNKRRRVGGKDDATYGIFADDEEDEGFGRRKGKQEKRLHFTQAPSFINSETTKTDQDEGNKQKDDDDDDIEEEDGEEQEEEPSEVISQPEFRADEEQEERPRVGIGGIGSATRQFSSASTLSRGGIGSSHTGIGASAIERESQGSNAGFTSATPQFGSSRGGIGSKKPNLGTSTDETLLPHAFGAASRPFQRSSLHDGTGTGTSSTPGTPKLSREEQLHFHKLQGSFGAKLMAKMGWQAGTGLGTSGEGIVTPVETKLRPKASMGLAFKGFKEKTAQSKAEARRRGEVVSEDEEDVPRKRGVKGKGSQKPQSDVWKKPKKTKVKVEHQTYEQIIQNAGQDAQTASIGKIYDATSGEMREVSSLADIASASWTPSTDSMRIPEVRHNLQLIVDAAKSDLDGLTREARALEERKKWVHNEGARLRQKVQEEAELIERLQNVHLIVDEMQAKSQLSSGDYEHSMDVFSPYIEKLVTEFANEYHVYRLDEIVVAAIAPTVRLSLASWQPLHDPTLLTDVFRRWRRALKFTVTEEKADLEVDVYGVRTLKAKPLAQDLTMTPYESLIWNAWLPKVRSCINNDWSPLDANPVVQLYEAWSTILPPFIRDNVLDQLVLPKVQKGIAEWQPHTGEPSLQAIVFPWLPHVGLRIEELLGEAKRKVKSLLRNCLVSDGIPEDLVAWKEVFGSSDWSSMMLKYIVPKLGVTLREDFKVNPRQQDMKPLENVLAWRPFLRTSVFSQLLETEFFPKWLDVLHIWLIQPRASFEEVAQWYAFWKSTFPQEVFDLPGVSNGFTRGLQLMNKAIELGPDASSALPRPDHKLPAPTTNGSRHGTPKLRPTPSRATEITFRSIVEEFAASHDLLFIPLGRVNEKSRMPLFRVSHSVDGKGGVIVFIMDDAVWAVEGENHRAISLEEMVLRANKSR
ncbi:TFP11-domain-containing protein [Ramaria rubella]|nr:TFP11-domain-containing protein [Ramaria rubella]